MRRDWDRIIALSIREDHPLREHHAARAAPRARPGLYSRMAKPQKADATDGSAGEELRRDLPNVRNRVDLVAEQMQESVDPHAVLDALAHDPEGATADTDESTDDNKT